MNASQGDFNLRDDSESAGHMESKKSMPLIAPDGGLELEENSLELNLKNVSDHGVAGLEKDQPIRISGFMNFGFGG